MNTKNRTRRNITEEVARALNEAGFRICGNRRVNNYGTQMFLENGCIVTCYDTGCYVIEGKNQEEAREALQEAMPESYMSEKEKRMFHEKQEARQNQNLSVAEDEMQGVLPKKEIRLQNDCLDLALHECANCIDGICLMTDKPCKDRLLKKGCRIRDGALKCDYFMIAVLPSEKELNDTIQRLIDDGESVSDRIRQCVDCGECFTPACNRQKRCRECGEKARKRTNASNHRIRYWAEE